MPVFPFLYSNSDGRHIYSEQAPVKNEEEEYGLFWINELAAAHYADKHFTLVQKEYVCNATLQRAIVRKEWLEIEHEFDASSDVAIALTYFSTLVRVWREGRIYSVGLVRSFKRELEDAFGGKELPFKSEIIKPVGQGLIWV